MKPKNRSLAACALLLGGSLLLSACGGTRASVRFDSARYPISMSGHLLDETGAHLRPEQTERVGEFRASGTCYGMLWSWLAFNDADLSSDLNEQVQAANGEAVVNLRLGAEQPVFPNVLPGVLFLHWLPIWPASVEVEAVGDIVRRRR